MNTPAPGIESLAPPASATPAGVALAGFLAYLLASAVIVVYRPLGDAIIESAIWLLVVTAGAIFAYDTLRHKAHLRPSTGLDPTRRNGDWSRVAVKYLGLLASLGFIAMLYWLFPEYHGAFYDRYYAALAYCLPVWLVLAGPYIHYVDRAMTEPRDGYWHLGQIVRLRWREADRGIVGQHLLAWLIKGFFLPLMFTYLCIDLTWLMGLRASEIDTGLRFYDAAYRFIFYIDVGLAALGYIFALRLFDTHVRSAEPTFLGWSVAIACYEPFWSILVARQYLAYGTGLHWDQWLAGLPALQVLWGGAILCLSGVYLWATVMFGARFSNLTHRGIVTNGAYRWTKHPAYIAKNLSWWLISVPFVVQSSPVEALRHSVLLLGLNLLYYLRARTEERHLGRDPDYARYAEWMREHGLFRFMARRTCQGMGRAAG